MQASYKDLIKNMLKIFISSENEKFKAETIKNLENKLLNFMSLKHIFSITSIGEITVKKYLQISKSHK